MSDIEALLSTIQADFLVYKDIESLRKIKRQSNVAKPEEELLKFSKLIHAQSTKIGIIFNPEKYADNKETAFKELKEMTNTFFYFLSLVPLFLNDKHSTIFQQEFAAIVLTLVSSFGELAQSIHNEEQRLIAVGKLWQGCKSLEALPAKGQVGILNVRINASIKMLNDALLEIAEWIACPEILNDDPFGLDSDDEESDAEVSDDLIEHAKIAQNKLKLVKLLMSSLQKSIPTKAAADKLNKLYDLQRNVSEYSDDLVADIMTGEKAPTDKLDTAVVSLCKVVTRLNEKDETKQKWLTTWLAKYKD